MLSMAGPPDWQGALETEDFTFLAAYGDDQLHYAIPKSLRLVDRPDSSPDFALEFVSNWNVSAPGHALFATINMCLSRGGDALAAYRALAERKPMATVLPATFSHEAYWYLEAGGTPQAVQQFAWEDVDRARVYKRIPTDLGLLVYNVLDGTGALPARTAIECGVAGILPRVPAAVIFQPGRLLQALGCVADSTSFDHIIERLVSDLTKLPMTFTGAPETAPRRQLALALAGRVLHELAQPVRTPDIGSGVAIAARGEVLERTNEPVVWDLRTPLLTTMRRMLHFDPFARILRTGGRDAVTFFTQVPPIPTDTRTQRVVVGANLPPNIHNVEAIDVTIRPDRSLSSTGQQPQTLMLHPPAARTTNTIDLKYRKSNPKRYSARICLVSEQGERKADWFECTEDYLYIGNDRLPGHVVTVRASSPLLQQATLRVALRRVDGTHDLTETLHAECPAVTFMLDEIREGACLQVAALDIADTSRVLVLDGLPCRSTAVDLPAFEDYGLQTVDVQVNFESGAEFVEFEFLPDCSDVEAITREFTPHSNSTTFSYATTNIFQSRFRYRRIDAGEWSAYQSPRRALILRV
jgi:hypothetical protein